MQFLWLVCFFYVIVFADVIFCSSMDPKHNVAALLTRIRDAEDYYATDKLSGWGYQGNCSFNQESLKQLAAMEGMGIWFNKVEPQEASKTPHPWSDYVKASGKFLMGEFANPITTDKQHVHLMDMPRSFYAIAAEAFKRGIFKLDESRACFNMYAPPSRAQRPKKSLQPPVSKGNKAKVGAILPPPSVIDPAPTDQLPPAPFPVVLAAKGGAPPALQLPSMPSAEMPPPKSLTTRLKEKLSKNKAKAALNYQQMIERSPPIIPGSKILLDPLSTPVVVQSSPPVTGTSSSSVPMLSTSPLLSSRSSSQSDQLPPVPVPVMLAAKGGVSNPPPASLISSPSLATVSTTSVPGGVPSPAMSATVKSSVASSSLPSATSTPNHPRRSVKEKEGCSISVDWIRQRLGKQTPSSASSSLPNSGSPASLPISRAGSALASLDDSGVGDVGPSPLKGSSDVQASNKVEVLEREINRELDDSYGPINVETNRRDHAYPPVFDKMGNLVKDLKMREKELCEKNVNLHREVEMLASRAKLLDDHLVKKVVAEVSKAICHELEVKTTLLESQIQVEGKNASRQISELGKKFENSISNVREEFGEAMEVLLDEGNNQPAAALDSPHHPSLQMEGDLRERINNKRSASPPPHFLPAKSAMVHLPGSSSAVPVTVCRASLFNTQPSVVQAQSVIHHVPNGQASFSPSQVVSCALVRSISLDIAN